MAKTARQDRHSPANLRPEDYELVGVFYQGSSEEVHEAYSADTAETWPHLEAHGWSEGNFATKGTCDHCGTPFAYGLAFRYTPTGEVIAVGRQCGSNSFEMTNAEKRFKHLRQHVAALKERAKKNKALREFLAANEGLESWLATEHRICRDLAEKCRRFGTLSPKQVALAKKLYEESLLPKPKGPEERDVATGRRDLTGYIGGTKNVEGAYGWTYKMMFIAEHADGTIEKIWTTVPAAITSELAAHGYQGINLHGMRATIKVTTEPSRKDPKFGIGKRPTLVSSNVADFIEAHTANLAAQTADAESVARSKQEAEIKDHIEASLIAAQAIQVPGLLAVLEMLKEGRLGLPEVAKGIVAIAKAKAPESIGASIIRVERALDSGSDFRVAGDMRSLLDGWEEALKA